MEPLPAPHYIKRKRRNNMILFTTPTCPKCKVVKMKLEKAGIPYTVNENLAEAEALGIKSVPQAQLETGATLDFAGIIAYIKQVEASKK